jgi:hypothetical protein
VGTSQLQSAILFGPSSGPADGPFRQYRGLRSLSPRARQPIRASGSRRASRGSSDAASESKGFARQLA